MALRPRHVIFPDGVKTFYAAQDVKLPNVSLKELACLPCRPRDYSDAQVAAALHKSGLGDFIEHLATTPARERPGIWFFQAARSRS